MTFEGLGIPTALIATPGFKRSAEVHAKAYGAPDFKSVILNVDDGSSIAGFSPERVQQFAEDIFEDVVAVLTGKPRAE